MLYIIELLLSYDNIDGDDDDDATLMMMKIIIIKSYSSSKLQFDVYGGNSKTFKH